MNVFEIRQELFGFDNIGAEQAGGLSNADEDESGEALHILENYSKFPMQLAPPVRVGCQAG
ncbi:MAG: hypothetical protein KBT68_07385 [bacterium]|nr:hypothetical protein [Candidatus Colisoma equi]